MSAEEMDHGGCSERHDDLATYALGALPAAEAAALEQHLAGCGTCSERLQWLRPAADLLPASVQQLNPPPELKRDLMAVVREEAPAYAPEPAAAEAADAGAPGPLRPLPDQAARRRPPAPGTRRLRRLLPRRRRHRRLRARQGW